MTNPFGPGDSVRTRPNVRPSRYASRSGTVREVRQLGPGGDPVAYIELGVTFGTHDASWFVPSEIELAHPVQQEAAGLVTRRPLANSSGMSARYAASTNAQRSARLAPSYKEPNRAHPNHP